MKNRRIYLSKGTVAQVSVWQKVVWLESAKIGTEKLSILKFFTTPLTVNKCEQKRSPSEKRDGNRHIFANSHWKILPQLLLAGGGYFGISQWLS
jgi:hypothetical protein